MSKEIESRPSAAGKPGILGIGLLLRLVLYGIAYWLAVKAGLFFVLKEYGIAGIWPASGLAVTVLLLSVPKERGLFALVTFAACLLGNLSAGDSLVVSAGYGLANTLEPVILVSVIHLLSGKKPFSLFRLNEVLLFIGATVVVVAFTALLGALIPSLGFKAPYVHVWLIWWLEDALGILILVPAIVLCLQDRRKLIHPFEGLAIGLLILGLYAFMVLDVKASLTQEVVRPYVFFGIWIWAAFRFPTRGVAVLGVMTSVVFLLGEKFGFDVFTHAIPGHRFHTMEIQVFLGELAATGLIVATILNERRRLEDSIRQSADQYRMIFDNSPVSIWEEDFSAVKTRFDELATSGVTDWSRYFESHPGEVERLAGLVRIRAVNQRSLRFFNAGSKEEIPQSLPEYFNRDSMKVFGRELAVLAAGGTSFESEIKVLTPGREVRDLFLTLSVVAGSEPDLGRVIVTFNDITEQKKLERDRQNIVENMIDGLAVHEIVCDAGGKPVDYVFLSVNPAFERLTGLKGTGIIGRRAREVLPNLEPSWIARYGEVALTGNPTHFEDYADELKKWFSVTAYRPAERQFACIFQDITDRKRTESALERSLGLYHDLVETSQDLIWQCDGQGRYIYLNPAWKDVLGYRVEEMIGRRFTEFQRPEDAARDEVEFDRLLHGHVLRGYETVHLAKDGRPVRLVFNAKSYEDSSGRIAGTRGTAFDVTAQQAASNALREANSEIERFFSLNLDLLCIANTEGYFLRLNQEWEAVLGYRVDELEGRKFLDMVHPDDLQSTLSVMSRLEGQEQIVDFVNRYRRKDGTWRWIEWRSRPVGNLIYAAARDITERRELEAGLRESSRLLKASQRVARIGSYVYYIPEGMWTGSEVLDEIFGIGQDYHRSVAGWTEIVHPVDREMMTDYLVSEVLGKRQRFDREYRILRVNSRTERWGARTGRTRIRAERRNPASRRDDPGHHGTEKRGRQDQFPSGRDDPVLRPDSRPGLHCAYGRIFQTAESRLVRPARVQP